MKLHPQKVKNVERAPISPQTVKTNRPESSVSGVGDNIGYGEKYEGMKK